MGLFEKKFCDICGEKIGMLGNRKLEDGNLCKDCAAKLSPYMTGRKHSTVDAIKEHLAYRERNQEQLKNFHPTMTLGDYTKVYIDQNMGAFIVSSSTNWRDRNPDIVGLNQVMNMTMEVQEHKEELKKETPEGRVSYNPPRYNYEYDLNILLTIDSPYFDEIRFDLNSSSDRPKSKADPKFKNLQQIAAQIENALLGRNTIASSIAGGMGMGMNNGMGSMNQMGMMSGMNNMNQMGMNNGMGSMNQMGMNNGMGSMNQMGMNSGMGSMNNMNGQMGMNSGMGSMNNMNGQMGMNSGMGSMNQMNGQMGMNNGMGSMNNMNGQMGMNNGMGSMNNMNGQMGMNNGMGNMNQMNGQMGMNNGMNNMNAQMGAAVGAAAMGAQMAAQGMNPSAGGTWVCACGTTNTGAFCEGCGNPRP